MTPLPEDAGVNDPHNPAIRAIAVKERREILKGLLKWAPITEKSLAGYLASHLHGTTSPTDTQVHSARVKLIHRHLPLLSDVGFITWDSESDTVYTTTHPALSDQRFRYLLRLGSTGLDDALDGLSHEYRRITLTALWEEETEQTVIALARKIDQCRDREGWLDTMPIEDIVTALHHAHLPKLVGYGHLKYDPSMSRVVYTGHPALEEVLSTIYEPDNYLVEKLDGLLSGLQDSRRSANSDSGLADSWPHHWRQKHD